MKYRLAIKNNISALMVTYGAMIFEGSILTMLIALMTPLSKDFNVDKSVISLLYTAQAIGTVSTIYIGGNISDRIGRKKVIFLGLMSYVIFLVGMFFTHDVKVALVLTLLAGIGHGLMDSPSISMLIDIFGDDSGPAMSVVAVFYSGGGALSAYIVGKFVHFDINYKLVFLIYLLLAVILAIIILSAKYPEKQVREVVDNKGISESTLNKQLINVAIFLAVITFMYAAANSILRTWISTYTLDVLNTTVEISIAMLTYLQIGNVLGAFVFAYVLMKVHSSKLMVINGFLASITLTLFLILKTANPILVMVAGAILSISFSLSLNIVGELFIENSGQATGFIGTATMASGMFMTFITGRLINSIGVLKIMWGMVVILVLAWIFSIVFEKVFINVRKKIIR